MQYRYMQYSYIYIYIEEGNSIKSGQGDQVLLALNEQRVGEERREGVSVDRERERERENTHAVYSERGRDGEREENRTMREGKQSRRGGYILSYTHTPHCMHPSLSSASSLLSLSSHSFLQFFYTYKCNPFIVMLCAYLNQY